MDAVDYLEHEFHDLQLSVGVLVWIVGVFGNLVNILVFVDKRMRSPVNSIFVCLAVCDLIELVLIAASVFLCDWCSQMYLFNFYLFVFSITTLNTYKRSILAICCTFLLLVIHTVTIGLNISLAFWRYFAIAYPLQRKLQLSYRVAALTTVAIFLLSFAVCAPILFTFTLTDLNFLHPESQLPMVNMVPRTDNLSWWIQFFNFLVLRIGLLAMLAVFSTLLILAILRVRRTRRQCLPEASYSAKERKHIDQVNDLVLMIVVMFLITELPFAVDGAVTMITGQYVMGDHVNPPYYLQLIAFQAALSRFQQLSFLVNSSYSVFCYLKISTPYRKTLKTWLRDKLGWLICLGCRADNHHHTQPCEMSTNIQTLSNASRLS